jgi:hypothetical protein
MRRFRVQFVTEIDFVDGENVSDAIARGLSEAPPGNHPGRRPAPSAADNQGRQGRDGLGHRNQG